MTAFLRDTHIADNKTENIAGKQMGKMYPLQICFQSYVILSYQENLEYLCLSVYLWLTTYLTLTTIYCSMKTFVHFIYGFAGPNMLVSSCMFFMYLLIDLLGWLQLIRKYSPKDPSISEVSQVPRDLWEWPCGWKVQHCKNLY